MLLTKKLHAVLENSQLTYLFFCLTFYDCCLRAWIYYLEQSRSLEFQIVELRSQQKQYMATKATSQADNQGDNMYQAFEQDRYPTWKLILEGIYLAFTIALWIKLIVMTVQAHNGPLPTLIGFIGAQFLVDYISGMVHWAADTWGTFKTPVFGPVLIGPFRMHHVDPQDIATHGWMETNASSSYPMPFFLIACIMASSGTFASQTMNWMLIFGVPLGIITNECHKWAHMVHTKPHPIVQFFQKAGLIISHQKHHVHHTGNFDSAYCIINGWMNPILEYIDYWRRLERLVTKVTGYEPRKDDKFWRQFKENSKQKSKEDQQSTK